MTTEASNQVFHALVVDDDVVVRRMVSFALQQEGFVCDSATDGMQARVLMDNREYDLLVTDLRMPNQHGHALAVDVLARESRPQIMVHTSVDDPRLTKDLIVRGVDDVVYKPANYAAFAAKAKGLVIRQRNERAQQSCLGSTGETDCADDSKPQFGLNADDSRPIGLSEMRATLTDVSKVLPVSHAALDVANMVRSDSFEAEQIAAAVQRDPAIAGKVLQLANNPFYNATGQQITDIKQAVIRIGQQRVGELALAMSAFASVTPKALPWMDLDLAWRRSVAAGVAVELLVAQGKHTRVSEGLLFSALMHASGRAVLGTHYAKRYEAMVKECIARNEALLKHETMTFPENHAEVMCGLLAAWNIPADVYQPLKYVLNDYPSLASLSEPMRTKVELVKLAILLGEIAVGSWEAWDLIELPPQRVLVRLGIDDIGAIIEETEAQLPGVADFRSDSRSSSAKDSPSRQLTYCNLSEVPFDFLAEIVPSMGITLNPVAFKFGKLRGGNVLVNRTGAEAEHSTARIFANAKCDRVVFVRDVDKLNKAGSLGTNITVPCSYAALRSACWEAAG